MSANIIITLPLECASEIIKTKLECKYSQTGKMGFKMQFLKYVYVINI